METLLFWVLGWWLAAVPAIVPVQAPTPADAGEENFPPVPAVQPVEKSVVVPKGDHEGSALVLPALPHGTYILTIPETGEATVTPAGVVKLVGPGPIPPGPNPPGPSPLTDPFAKAIKAAADKATGDADRVNTAQGLAMLYRSISAEAHKAGTSATLESVSNTTLMVTDMAVSKQGATAVAAWADMRAALRAAMVDAIQKGQAVSQMGDLLDQAASGLEASAPSKAEKAPSPEFWAFLLKLIEMLLPLLLPK